MLINLIRNDIGVIFHRQIRDDPKLSIGKYLSAGIGRITQYQRLRPLPEGLFQFSHMEGKGRGFSATYIGSAPANIVSAP